jgi:hypothetical protein
MMNYQDFNNLQEAYLSVYEQAPSQYNLPPDWEEQRKLRRQQNQSTSQTSSVTPTGKPTDPSRRVSTGKPPLPTGFKVPPSGTPGPIRPSGTPTGGPTDPSRRVSDTKIPPNTSSSSSTTKPASTSSTRNSSSTNTSTSDKIKGGMEVWKQQKASGDFKSADETGKSVWALANPKLAAASAERERTRGTSATTNPLMKDMKSKLPAPQTTSKPNPTNSSALGSSDIRQKFAAASVRTVTAPPSVSKPIPKPTPAATGSKKPGSIVSSFDLFDVVMGYLLDEGYAETPEAAEAIMVNMSEEWRESIVEDLGEVRSRLMKRQRKNASSFVNRTKPRTSFRERLEQKALQKKLESL